MIPQYSSAEIFILPDLDVWFLYIEELCFTVTL